MAVKKRRRKGRLKYHKSHYTHTQAIVLTTYYLHTCYRYRILLYFIISLFFWGGKFSLNSPPVKSAAAKSEQSAAYYRMAQIALLTTLANHVIGTAHTLEKLRTKGDTQVLHTFSDTLSKKAKDINNICTLARTTRSPPIFAEKKVPLPEKNSHSKRRKESKKRGREEVSLSWKKVKRANCR